MLKKIIYGSFAIYFIFSIICGAVLSCRLERYRQQLEYYRIELESAANRESDIAKSLQRTGEILSSSIYTVAELRNAINEVRKNYEAMEDMLHSTNSSSSIGSNNMETE